MPNLQAEMRAGEEREAAEALLAALRRQPEDEAPDVSDGKVEVQRYTADEMRALRDSPYSQLPTRPLTAMKGLLIQPSPPSP